MNISNIASKIITNLSYRTNKYKKRRCSAPIQVLGFIFFSILVIFSFESLGLDGKSDNLNYRDKIAKDLSVKYGFKSGSLKTQPEMKKSISNSVTINKYIDEEAILSYEKDNRIGSMQQMLAKAAKDNIDSQKVSLPIDVSDLPEASDFFD